MDRRAFLTLLAMAGAGAAAQPIARASGKRVVVFGGGLSGLATAWNLMNHGYDVRVFEAQDIPGGRVRRFVRRSRTGATPKRARYASSITIAIP
jgi:cation diffusion facilitator CzcD-associated flavoprotein CzcO